jgi:hypothetical protein
MLARTLALAACVLTASSAADAQQLLNPTTWFNSGYNQNCPGGVCPPAAGYGVNNSRTSYYGASGANGFCATPAQNYNQNCPGGICPVPNTGYNSYRPVTPQPYYPTAIRPNTQPNYYGNVNNSQYHNNAQYRPLPYSTTQQRPLPVHSVSAPRYNSNNSPFYP